MSAPLPLIARTRLEKAAHDNGFDRALGAEGQWLVFESSHARGRLWMTEWAGSHPIAAFSHPGVVHALADHGVAASHPMPAEAAGARSVNGYDQLHALLRRAMSLSRTLPDALWERFGEQIATMPQTTEAERLAVQRVGQNVFRQGLLDLWGNRCAISGLAVPALLRASHAKPWKDCATDRERLDAHNGLLLAAHLDAAFDSGLITLEDDGRVIVSAKLDEAARGILGLGGPARVRGLAVGHRVYLAWHRERVFASA
jgi:putative restriction endonuclease